MTFLKLLTCSFLLSTLFVGCTNKNEADPSDKAMMKVINKTAKELSKKKKLHFDGFGGSGVHEVKMMHISVSCDQKLDLHDARKLMIEIAELFLKNINKDQKLRLYLHNYPFEPRNIEIFVVLDRDISSKEIISLMTLAAGEIGYSYRGDDRKLYDFLYEPYEEALKKVNEGKHSPEGGRENEK